MNIMNNAPIYRGNSIHYTISDGKIPQSTFQLKTSSFSPIYRPRCAICKKRGNTFKLSNVHRLTTACGKSFVFALCLGSKLVIVTMLIARVMSFAWWRLTNHIANKVLIRLFSAFYSRFCEQGEPGEPVSRLSNKSRVNFSYRLIKY
jgi:hypothetical protein